MTLTANHSSKTEPMDLKNESVNMRKRDRLKRQGMRAIPNSMIPDGEAK